MQTHTSRLAASAWLIATLAAIPAMAEEMPSHDAQRAVFEAKCGLCHPLAKPLSERRSAEQWAATVERMAGKSPDLMTGSDVRTISAYLAEVQGLSRPSSRALPRWVTPALGVATLLTAFGTMTAGLIRRRLGRAFRLHKYGALTAAVLWLLHALSVWLH